MGRFKIGNNLYVLSWVPRGSVLGFILFLVCISDSEEKVTSTVLKFADGIINFLEKKLRKEETNENYNSRVSENVR